MAPKKAFSEAEHKEHKEFWEDVASDMDKYHKRAAKLAETVRDVKVVMKVAGRTVPNSTHYVQTVTKSSKMPIKKA